MTLKRTLSMALSMLLVLGVFAPCLAEPSAAAQTSSLQTAATLLSAEKDGELQANLQARIDEILANGTAIVHSDTFIPGETYTGTAYYVSADGNDENDGLTPETAWQSVGKLLQELDQREGSVLQPGDAVFLRRGDIFRLPEWALEISVNEITLSAYGEGEKPIITASSENGTGEEKWQLVYEDESGKKIWQYYHDMRDVSRIVLNDGEAITTRIYEYYDENGYISCEATGWWMHESEGVTLLDALLPLEESMIADLTIISRPEREGWDYSSCNAGPLYLRCDSGNLGALYESIEFSEYQPMGLFWLESSETVFDNISFQCNGNSYIKAGIDWKDIQNTVIQHCEFAYGGCSVTSYHEREDGAIVVEVQGDGIYNIIRNTTIQNNYFHDMAATTVTYEADVSDNSAVGGCYRFVNNIAVNTIGIRLDSTSPSLQYLDSVQICGNQVWNTGRMDNGKYGYSEGSLVLMPNHYGECIVTDNVFYTTENGHAMNALLDIFLYYYEDMGYTRPQFGNNTYVQYADRDFVYLSMHDNETWRMDDPTLLTKAAEHLWDTTSAFYIIE